MANRIGATKQQKIALSNLRAQRFEKKMAESNRKKKPAPEKKPKETNGSVPLLKDPYWNPRFML